jgi:hemolysin activation/secretion protein
MINTGVNEGSAKIYQFPVGGRSALAGGRYGETKPELALPVNVADCSGSWYHAEAIQDAKTGRDH